jgi:hypothetical protein
MAHLQLRHFLNFEQKKTINQNTADSTRILKRQTEKNPKKRFQTLEQIPLRRARRSLLRSNLNQNC